MMRLFILPLLFLAFLFGFQNASVAQEVVDSFFAPDVIEMNPVNPFEPGVTCENGAEPSGPMPVIDSQEVSRIFLWTRIKSSEDGVLRHSWYKDGVEMAVVDLELRESPEFRTWSSKNIDPNFHTGNWKVVVTAASDPSDIICTAHFLVN
jgi:hypothetical protein